MGTVALMWWHCGRDVGKGGVALRGGQWDRCGGTEVMGKGWVALRWGHWGQMWWHRGGGERMGGTERRTLGTGVTLQWGHWGHNGWHHIGDSGTDVVAPR